MDRIAKIQYAIALQEKIKRESEKKLSVFLKHYAWPVLQPGTPFVGNWHIDAICEHLEAVNSGQIKRLIINLPFRMLKSTIVSQAFPAWEWIRRSHLQYLTASYAKDVATRDAVDCRKIIESGIYQDAWGHKFKMTSDQNVKTRYENDQKGSRVVTATDAAGTGFGGNRIIIDDPVSALEADSPNARENSIEWWKGTASTRLNNPKDDAIIVVHQRLHQNDLTGYILANESGWDQLILPMRYDPAKTKTTSLGFKDPRTVKGELMSPVRLDEATVVDMEERLGSYHVKAQLQQDPIGREGTIFQKGNWKYYHVPPAQIAADMDEIIWSWDCSFKGLDTSDYTAGHCIGRKGADKYLLHRVCARMGFGVAKTTIHNETKRKPFSSKLIATLIEDKANGPAIIDALKQDIFALTPISPQGGKEARANAVQPQHEAGNFYLPSPTMPGFEWVLEFVDMFSEFPGIPNDDDIDAWTQGVNWYTTRENFKKKSSAPATAGSRNFN